MQRSGEIQALDPLELAAEAPVAVPGVGDFLHHLRESRLLTSAELDGFLDEQPRLLLGRTPELVKALIQRGLLTEYQARRVLAGRAFGLVLGHYRIVERLGVGGMGVVYKAEHIHMKRVVAIKVLAAEGESGPLFLDRFHSEMQALAVLRHPNIVLAFDAGEVDGTDDSGRVLRYLVMEYVVGQNLEHCVLDRGPLPVVEACDLIRQAADGLRHAHEHGLVHRDIKPSNLFVTPQGQVKILDFGLARLCWRRCTEAFTTLGTVEYMAPEQARDARAVDIRTDIYGLGGTFYWLLTGQKPFPSDRPPIEALLARQCEAPVPLRRLRNEVPLELDAIVCQMMAHDPSDRFPTPLALLAALNGFCESHALAPHPALVTEAPASSGAPTHHGQADDTRVQPQGRRSTAQKSVHDPDALHQARILLVASQPSCRATLAASLKAEGLDCTEAEDLEDARAHLAQARYDLLILDERRGGRSAMDLLGEFSAGSSPDAEARRERLLAGSTVLRAPGPTQLRLVILGTADDGTEALAGSRSSEPDDVLPWPATPQLFRARVRAALRLKAAEENLSRLTAQLAVTGRQLDQAVRQREQDAAQAQDLLLFALAKMTEFRGMESPAHLKRMQAYMRPLAEEVRRLPPFTDTIDDAFVRLLERSVVLHDLGKIAIPDHILLKPGRLDAEERSIMESHTVLGAGMLDAVGRQHGSSLPLLTMAAAVARHHHERHDGRGYPDGLTGDSIPLPARLAALADVYDALRSKLVYKPGLTHAAARRLILDETQGQFDPSLLVAFRSCEACFEQIFEQHPD